jgi:hypothetical protein
LDEQEVPKKLQLLIKRKEEAKEAAAQKRLQKKASLKPEDPEAVNEKIRKSEEKKLLNSAKHLGYA